MKKKKWIISDNSRKFSTLARKIWIPRPPTVIPFLPFESCRNDKIRINDPEISSIVYEIIRTNLEPVIIFFFTKRF